MAGWYDSSAEVSCYWTSTGTGTTRRDLLGEGTHSAFANSIYVADGTVYTAGGYGNGAKQIPCYWRGAEKVDLQDGVAMSIFVP